MIRAGNLHSFCRALVPQPLTMDNNHRLEEATSLHTDFKWKMQNWKFSQFRRNLDIVRCLCSVFHQNIWRQRKQRTAWFSKKRSSGNNGPNTDCLLSLENNSRRRGESTMCPEYANLREMDGAGVRPGILSRQRRSILIGLWAQPLNLAHVDSLSTFVSGVPDLLCAVAIL